ALQIDSRSGVRICSFHRHFRRQHLATFWLAADGGTSRQQNDGGPAALGLQARRRPWRFAMNRRSFLISAAGMAGAAMMRPAWPASEEPALGRPPEICSANGLLTAALTAAPGPVQLGEISFPGVLYNGAYIPPLLRV